MSVMVFLLPLLHSRGCAECAMMVCLLFVSALRRLVKPNGDV